MLMAERCISRCVPAPKEDDSMMANEIGAWLWIFADGVLLTVLAAILLGCFVVPSLRGSSLAPRVKNLVANFRLQMLGKVQHPQKSV